MENRCAGALVLYIESALRAAFGRAPRYGDVAVAERFWVQRTEIRHDAGRGCDGSTYPRIDHQSGQRRQCLHGEGMAQAREPLHNQRKFNAWSGR